MKEVFSHTFPSGTIRADATSVTLVNNTAKTTDISVPTDGVWELQIIKVTNPDDVARVVTVSLYTTPAKTVLVATLVSGSVNAGSRLMFPHGVVSASQLNMPNRPFLLGATWTIEVVHATGGASTGGTDAAGIVCAYRRYSYA